jgi:hypothetical protein
MPGAATTASAAIRAPRSVTTSNRPLTWVTSTTTSWRGVRRFSSTNQAAYSKNTLIGTGSTSVRAIPASSRNASNVWMPEASRCQSTPERRNMPAGM